MRGTGWLFCVLLVVGGCSPRRLPMKNERSSPQDLAISGDVPGIPAGGQRFIRFADLKRLRQVASTVGDDENFSRPMQLSGVPLDTLAAALGIRGKEVIAALCTDGYEGHYTAEYREEHHPFLVLEMGGQDPEKWPRQQDGSSYGPYVISHASFRPAYRILAHQDEAQIPTNVTELRFYSEERELARLEPEGKSDSPAAQGARIAYQNCLRCHRDGEIGGTKSPFTYEQLHLLAQVSPEMFGNYVVRPQMVNPGAKMPANPGYDAATIAALTAYFRGLGAKP